MAGVGDGPQAAERARLMLGHALERGGEGGGQGVDRRGRIGDLDGRRLGLASACQGRCRR
jgi:hypothetical protein